MEEKKNDNSIQAIDRALRTLELVATNGPMSLKELYTTLDINKASMSRIAATLCNNGYLNRDVKGERFSLSFKPFEIGVNAVRSISYINIVKSLLERLSGELDVTAQFSIEDNNEMLVIECFNKNNSNFSIYADIGKRAPMYATSSGKAILSSYSNDELLGKWEKLNVHRITPNTITTFEGLVEEIATIRQRGYAVDRQENERGVFCVGTALLNYNRHPVGAISLSTPTMTEEKERHLSEVLLERTQRIAFMLGYTST